MRRRNRRTKPPRQLQGQVATSDRRGGLSAAVNDSMIGIPSSLEGFSTTPSGREWSDGAYDVGKPIPVLW